MTLRLLYGTGGVGLLAIAFTSLGCIGEREPPDGRILTTYGTFFDLASRTKMSLPFQTRKGEQKSVRVYLVGGLAKPGEPVTPMAIRVELASLSAEKETLLEVGKGLILKLTDSDGKEYSIKAPELVNDYGLLYGIENWGAIWINKPAYHLLLKGYWGVDGPDSAATVEYTCRRGRTGLGPIRADAQTRIPGDAIPIPRLREP